MPLSCETPASTIAGGTPSAGRPLGLTLGDVDDDGLDDVLGVDSFGLSCCFRD